MPGSVSLKTLGNWRKEIGVPLEDALAVSMHEFGYTGEKACRQAIYFMGQSAGKLAKKAPKNRKVEVNPDFKHLLRKSQYKSLAMAGATKLTLQQWYMRYRAMKLRQPPHTDGYLYSNVRDTIRNIHNRGLASRSWMWGFAKGGKAIPGVTKLHTVTGGLASRGEYMSGETGGNSIVNGYVLVNRLSYINAAMPAGWEQSVARSATNRIMGRFRSRLESRWREEMGLPRRARKAPKAEAQFLARYFKDR